MKKLGNLSEKHKKTMGIVLVTISTFILLILIIGFIPFVKSFLCGAIGLISYPLMVSLITIGILLTLNKKILIQKKYLWFGLGIVLCMLLILQVVLSYKFMGLGYGNYLSSCYAYKITAGGVLLGVLSYPLMFVLTDVGCYVILSIIIVVLSAFIIDRFIASKKGLYQPKIKIKKGTDNKTIEAIDFDEIDNQQKTINQEIVKEKKIDVVEEKSPTHADLAKEKLGLSNKKELSDALYSSTKFDIDNDKFKAKTGSGNEYLSANMNRYNSAFVTNKTSVVSNDLSKNISNKVDSKPYIIKPNKINTAPILSAENYEAYKNNQLNIINSDNRNVNIEHIEKEFDNIREVEELSEGSINSYDERLINKSDVDSYYNEDKYRLDEKETLNSINSESIINDNMMEEEDQFKKFNDNKEDSENKTTLTQNNSLNSNNLSISNDKIKNIIPINKYNRPSLDMLSVVSTDLSCLEDDTFKKKGMLEQALESFKIPAKVTGVVIGPAVTRYEIVMPAGISVKKVLGYADDIAMALESNGGVRIEAPIPGRNAVGIEVPNDKVATVGLKEVLESKSFWNSDSPLTFGLGKDIAGEHQICNLAKMPHLLVAGSTGSGKSVCLNTLLISLIYKSSPEDVRFVLIDPKRVEFASYKGLPHLMIPNIITEPDKAINAFNWAIMEMENRYTTFQINKVRDISEFNKMPAVINREVQKMAHIVIIVDELADLMSVNKREIEEKIMRLAAKARSAGIHLVLATQRPSVDVITGVIKANLPSRIAFAVTSFADSKTILDKGGADKLLGRGDMLYAPLDAAEPKRIQGAFISNEEVLNIVEYVKSNNKCIFEDNLESKMLNKSSASQNENVGAIIGEQDELFVQAVRCVIENNQASISSLQRRFGIGYGRAAKLIDAMEELKFIGPSEGAKPRQIYITEEEFDEKYGNA